MSSKLYNGIRFKSRNMADILKQLISIRKEVVLIANSLLTIEEIEFFILFNKLGDKNKIEIFKEIEKELCSLHRQRLSLNFNFSIALIPEKKGYVYGYYFADNEKEYFDAIKPFIEDYHYQNQCDKPENISSREWNRRYKKWNKLLGYDTFFERAFIYNIVQPSDLNYFETLKKIDEIIKKIEK